MGVFWLVGCCHGNVVTITTQSIIYQQTEQASEVVDWFISHLKVENSLRSLAVVGV